MAHVAVVEKQATQLIRYDAACRALAEAKAVDEVLEMRNKSDAMRIYGMQAKNKSLEVDAAEIRIRAERRLGELLIEQKKGEGLNVGARMNGCDKAGTPVVVTHDRREIPTLVAAGISKDLSSRAQKIASVPKAEFEAEVSDWRGRVEAENARVTTRLESAGAKAISKKPAPTIESLQAENADLRDQLEAAEQNARELADMLEGFSTADEGAKQAAKEIATLKGLVRTVETQRNALMTTNNELKREVKSKQARIDKLEKAGAK